MGDTVVVGLECGRDESCGCGSTLPSSDGTDRMPFVDDVVVVDVATVLRVLSLVLPMEE